MHPLAKFGLLVLSGSSISMVILRVMVYASMGIGTPLYVYLEALAILLPLIWALALTMIVASRFNSLPILGFVFIASLVIGILIVAPAFTGVI